MSLESATTSSPIEPGFHQAALERWPSRASRRTVIKLEGKTILITGAGSGLGRQLAVDIAGRGVRLVLADINESGLKETAGQVESAGSKAIFKVTDVTNESQCRDLVRFAKESFGDVHCLILCAGISMWANFDEITDLSLFQRLMAVNFFGAVYCIHPALSSLRANRGMIVTISSLQGELGVPHHTGYSAAKHALNGFLESLEFELGDEIHLLNIMPGWISGTQLRASAYHSDGTALGEQAKKHNGNSVTVEEASRRILAAMDRDAKSLFIPKKLRYLALLKLLVPNFVKWLVQRAIDKQEASKRPH